MIHCQELSAMEIATELEEKCGVETQRLLQKLWQALQTFSGFPSGDYLLRSDVKHNDHIKVYEKTENDE